ncbi:MAG: TetR/AcrR family transcriptional regulator [Leptospiraceae bacterium]|nr:TetR/AcrR family transcriptional regulator [Leptospiraceae bacterium]
MGRTSRNKEKIIQNAVKLFWSHGYEAVGVNDLCEATGINKGTLYHFYQGKEEIALEVLDFHFQQLKNFFQSISNLSPKDRIIEYYKLVSKEQKNIINVTGSARGCPIGVFSIELSPKDGVLQKKIISIFHDIEVFFFNAILEITKNKTYSAKTASEFSIFLQGALLMCRTQNSTKPLNSLQSYFENNLKYMENNFPE